MRRQFLRTLLPHSSPPPGGIPVARAHPLAISLLALVFPVPTPAPSPRTTAHEALPPIPAQAARAIPLEVVGEGLAFVKGKVRAADVWLLLDTASPSVLSERLANRLGFSGQETPSSGLRQEQVPIRVLRDVTVGLPGADVTQASVSSFDLDRLQMALGHQVDGILGTPFFEGFVVEIDFAHSTLSLHDPRTYRYSARGAIALTRQEGFPYARAQLALAQKPLLDGEFLIDTGSDSAVVLYSPFVDAHRLLGPGTKAPPDSDVGAGGGSLEAVVRADKLQLGPFAFGQPIVQLSRSTKGRLADPKHAGLVGGAILSRFRVIFDYPHNRLILEKNTRYAEPFLHDASGLTLAAQGPDLSTFEIRRITPGSPAAAAGLVMGDVILAVDGKPVKDIGLHALRRLLQQDGKQYVLSVFREGAIRHVTIVCRKLL